MHFPRIFFFFLVIKFQALVIKTNVIRNEIAYISDSIMTTAPNSPEGMGGGLSPDTRNAPGFGSNYFYTLQGRPFIAFVGKHVVTRSTCTRVLRRLCTGVLYVPPTPPI